VNLEDLGNIGEFVGAVAVVISIIYLAVQVHRNTEAVDTTIDFSYVEFYFHWLDSFSSQEQTEIIVRGLENPEQLSDAEAVVFSVALVRFVTFNEALLQMHARGVISEERWQVMRTDVVSFLGTIGGRLWWRTNRQGFTISLGTFIDDALADSSIKPYSVAHWRDGSDA